MGNDATRSIAGGNPSESSEEADKTLVKRGYAREGDVVATVVPAVFGRDGKNVLGEILPVRKVYIPRLMAGMNVVVEKGNRYIIRTTGVVEVLRDEKGIFYIRGKRFMRGTCSVSLSEDEMTAWLSLTPSIGGARPVTVDDVRAECERLGISFGIDSQAIESAVHRLQESVEAVSGIVIACGEQPVNGTDGSIEFHVVRASGSTVKLREDGSVDYKDLDQVTSVKQDQLIAVLKREQAGQKDGHTVRGEICRARAGKPVVLELGNNIRVEDRGDALEHYACINGQLLTSGRKLSVEPVLVIEGDVGPKTGHIQFNGVVHVRGSVRDTFNVFAEKDVIVEGNVGNCIIKTDGNLTVYGGVMGKNRGNVQVGGDVRVKFAENSSIRAGGNIHIQRAALNCTLVAGSWVIAVAEKGQIVGGEIKAREGVEVKTLGNESENRMEVRVGSDFSVEDRLEEIEVKIQKYEKALKKIVLVLDKLKRAHANYVNLPEKLRIIFTEIRKKENIARGAIEELRNKQVMLMNALSEIQDAKILVRETLNRGVKLYFGKVAYEPETAESKVSITYDRKRDKVQVKRLF